MQLSGNLCLKAVQFFSASKCRHKTKIKVDWHRIWPDLVVSMSFFYKKRFQNKKITLFIIFYESPKKPKSPKARAFCQAQAQSPEFKNPGFCPSTMRGSCNFPSFLQRWVTEDFAYWKHMPLFITRLASLFWLIAVFVSWFCWRFDCNHGLVCVDSSRWFRIATLCSFIERAWFFSLRFSPSSFR